MRKVLFIMKSLNNLTLQGNLTKRDKEATTNPENLKTRLANITKATEASSRKEIIKALRAVQLVKTGNHLALKVALLHILLNPNIINLLKIREAKILKEDKLLEYHRLSLEEKVGNLPLNKNNSKNKCKL